MADIGADKREGFEVTPEGRRPPEKDWSERRRMPTKSKFRQTYGMVIPDEYPRIEQFPGLSDYLRQRGRADKGWIEISADAVEQLRAFQATWQRIREVLQIYPLMPSSSLGSTSYSKPVRASLSR